MVDLFAFPLIRFRKAVLSALNLFFMCSSFRGCARRRRERVSDFSSLAIRGERRRAAGGASMRFTACMQSRGKT